MLSILGAVAEWERLIIRARQKEGIAVKRANFGKDKKLAPHAIVSLVERARAGADRQVLAREFGISRSTMYEYLKSVA